MEYTDGTNSALLYYITNLSGDVVALCTPEGDIAATYSYSAWGHTTVTLGNGTGITEAVRTASGLNPFRYRSYYYDAETEFYYCNSRYYDPQIYRWLNADSALYYGLLGYNLFLYCNNNPTNYVDRSGENAQAVWGAIVSAGGVASMADGFLPFGDIVLVVGLIGFAIVSSKPNDFAPVLDELTLPSADTQHLPNAPETPDNGEKETDENEKPIVKPGQQPTAEDGYDAPKDGPAWDKVRHGWRDKYGNVWVPAPTGSNKGHGGGHWDVQSPRGGYTNVYPGRVVRGGKKPYPHLPKLSIF